MFLIDIQLTKSCFGTGIPTLLVMAPQRSRIQRRDDG